MCRRMRVLCRVWQRRNKRVGGADDERIIIDRSWLSACKQRCTEPVPWNLSIPWSIKKCKNSSRYGRSRCLCYHDFFVCNGADLPVYFSAAAFRISAAKLQHSSSSPTTIDCSPILTHIPVSKQLNSKASIKEYICSTFPN